MTPGQAIAELERWGGQLSGVQKRCHFEIGKILLPEARKNAPKSPTRQTLNRIRKTKRKTRRNPRATSRHTPGTLEKSIQTDANEQRLEIGVPSNSNAGQYAYKMHEEKGRTWFKRGPGTVQKGAHADEKFIERAIEDNDANGLLAKIIAYEVERGIPK